MIMFFDKKIKMLVRIYDNFITFLKEIKRSIIKNQQLLQKTFLLALAFIFSFVLGLSLGVTQKQAISVIFKKPQGALMEFSPDFFDKMDQMFQIANQQKINSNDTKPELNYQFVASKKGKNYYPINCPAVKNLSDKNKIYFNFEDEAKKLGYTLSKSCK